MNHARTVCIACLLIAVAGVGARAQPLGDSWGTAEREAEYYRIVDLPMPEGLGIEAGSFEALPDGRLAVGTRRGDIYLITGATGDGERPTYHRYAAGLDEVFGLDYHEGAFIVTQPGEVTRITDTDGDDRGDRFETLSDEWGFAHYHEFAFGSDRDAEGNVWVALGLSESYHSKTKFRGWAMKITPDGRTIPVASGLRSPGGIGPNEHGVMFYVESQGPWNGSCSLKHLKSGGFMGHPISYNWYADAPSMGPPPESPKGGTRLRDEADRIPQLVPYAVVFPYRKMGQSISGFRVDDTGGKFGPFQNQLFVGDYSLSLVMRATTEQVKGVWQGACYPFREGFATGLLALQFTPNGRMIVGGTSRGWPVRGPQPFALQRVQWTGRMPFEIERISARHDGFELTFTKPVDPAVAAAPATYRLTTYTHVYQGAYGSPEVDHTTPRVTKATVSADARNVRIVVDGLMRGHVHDFHLPAMIDADGGPLLHTRAYYTLNEVPDPSE